MAPLKCCVGGCNATSDSHRLFSMPKDDNLRNLWMFFLVPTNPSLIGLTKEQLLRKRVCQKHFDRYQMDGQGRRTRYSYPCLFSAKEIAYGIPLCSEDYHVLAEHNYHQHQDENDFGHVAEADTSLINDGGSFYEHSYASTSSTMPSCHGKTQNTMVLPVSLLEQKGNMTLTHLPVERLKSRWLCMDHFDSMYICKRPGCRTSLSRVAVPYPYYEEDPEKVGIFRGHSPSPKRSPSPGITFPVLTPKKVYSNKRKMLEIKKDYDDEEANQWSTPRSRRTSVPVSGAGEESLGENSDFDDELDEAVGDDPIQEHQIEVTRNEINDDVFKEETVEYTFNDSERVGFVPATTDNLPEVNMFAVIEYLSNNEKDFKQLDYPKLKILTKNNPSLITSIKVLQTESTYRVRGTVNFDRMTSHMCEIEYDTHTDTITSSECVCGSNPCEHTAAFVMFLSHKPTNKRTERLQVNKSRECDSRSKSSDDDDAAPSTSTSIPIKMEEEAEPSAKRQRSSPELELSVVPEPEITIVPLPKDENEPGKSKIECIFPRKTIYTLWNNTTGSCPERCKQIQSTLNKQLQDDDYITDFSPLQQWIEHLCDLFDKMKDNSEFTEFLNMTEVIELEREAIKQSSLLRDPLS